MRKAASGIILTLLLVGMSALGFNIHVCAFAQGDCQEELRVWERTDVEWTAGETGVWGFSECEKRRLCGDLGVVTTLGHELSLDSYPSSFDWRSKDGLDWTTPVRSQGNCGSCYIFGSLAVVEALVNIEGADPEIDRDLSEQFVLSCCPDFTCSGGSSMDVFDFVKSTGVPDEACFPYGADDTLTCDAACLDWEARVTKIMGWNSISLSKENLIAHLLNGPVTASMEVYEDFTAYVNGIYEHVWGDYLGKHVVAIVGYDDVEGYWICKNSWGTGWGEDGWFRIKYGECGIDSLHSEYAFRTPTIVFDTVAYYPEESACALWLGDLNHDVVVDLAVTSEELSSVTVMLGMGDCTFSSGLSYSVGELPRGICGGDFDEDGDVDLATANQLSNSVSVLLNEGKGLFESALEFTAGTGAIDVCCGDFDGDGDVDLATANYCGSGNFSVLLNNGDAIFDEVVEYMTGGTWSTSIVARDFDMDGDIDVAVGNQAGAGGGFASIVSVLLNYGDGSFGDCRNYDGENIWDVSSEDFDGDGDFDLAVANSWGGGFDGTGHGVSILLNDGDAFFTLPGEYLVGTNPEALFAEDFDADGDVDLAVTTSNHLSILVNSGDGAFSEDSRHHEGQSFHMVCGADLDYDSDIDLVATSRVAGNITVLRNELPLQPPIVDLNDDRVVDIMDVAIAAASFGSYPEHPRWNPQCDLDKNLRVDLADLLFIAKNFGTP